MRKPYVTALVAIAAMSVTVSACSNANSPDGQGTEEQGAGGSTPQPAQSTATPSNGGAGGTTEDPSETITGPAPGESTTATNEAADPASADIIDNPPEHSWQDALDAALAEFDGDVTAIELELRDSGRLEYEIELISADTEYEVKFDARTLEEISVNRDDLGSDAKKDQNKIFDPAAMIPLQKAVEIARGAQEGAITKWKLEGQDSGLVEYEFEIYPQGSRHDVEVTLDATDGTVLEID